MLCCDPHLHKDIDKLQSVQRLACKICTKNWSASYSDQLHVLNLPIPLVIADYFSSFVYTMYKILNNTSFPENIINLRSGLQTHPMFTRHILQRHCILPWIKQTLNSFVPSTTTLWNGLPLSLYVFVYLLAVSTFMFR